MANAFKPSGTKRGVDRSIDLTGRIFGYLKVLEKLGVGGKRKAIWLCECQVTKLDGQPCGNRTSVRGEQLRSGNTKSCGCLKRGPKPEDLTGKRFGFLEPIRRVGSVDSGNSSKPVWLCICRRPTNGVECNQETTVRADQLKSGNTKSCGCLLMEELSLGVSRKPKGVAAFNRTLAQYKINAKLRGFKFGLTDEQFRDEISKPCHYCAKAPEERFFTRKANGNIKCNGLDRIDNSKGYIVGNVVACCHKCNRAKDTMTKDEFLAHIKCIYESHFRAARGGPDTT